MEYTKTPQATVTNLQHCTVQTVTVDSVLGYSTWKEKCTGIEEA
jgi:aromatic ring hydroxylase